MADFIITAVDPNTNKLSKLLYSNSTSKLTDMLGVPFVKPLLKKQWNSAKTFDSNNPVGKTSPKILKISLGLSCNYECEYCNQRFMPRASDTNLNDVAPFINSLDNWVKQPPDKIEFWGGEPLVYIKTLRPLAEALKLKYPSTQFSIITNGSLLTLELNNWLDTMGFNVAISHDGPGQHVRGPDPLNDEKSREAILDLYRRLSPHKRISFASMINRHNQDRAAIVKFFIELTKDVNVPISEGTLIDAYDDDAVSNSLSSEDFAKFRVKSYDDIRSGKAINFVLIGYKINSFINSIRTERPSAALGQKCGMDKTENIAVDLNGNVLTCQNVSVAGTSLNGESHKLGNISNIEEVKLKTSRHWSTREECPKCPMLQICQGSCMYLEGKFWQTSCDNAYSDAIPIFAAGIESLTGLIPLYIDGEHREDRRDLWNPPVKKSKKVIPIMQER